MQIKNYLDKVTSRDNMKKCRYCGELSVQRNECYNIKCSHWYGRKLEHKLHHRKFKLKKKNHKIKVLSVILVVGVAIWAIANLPAIASYIQPETNLTNEIPTSKPVASVTSIPNQPTHIVAVAPPVIVQSVPIHALPMAQSNLVNPTWNQLKAFLLADKTDELKYVYPTFVCEDFAKTLQTSAKKSGWRCAIVSIKLSGYPDWYKLGIPSNTGHACNAFQTTDKGLVYIDCTRSVGIGPINQDNIVDVKVGNRYIPYAIFPSEGWNNESGDMGLITAVSIEW